MIVPLLPVSLSLSLASSFFFFVRSTFRKFFFDRRDLFDRRGGEGKGISRRVRGIVLGDEWMSSVNESVWLFRCYLSLSLSLLSRVFLLFRSFYVPWRWDEAVLEKFFFDRRECFSSFRSRDSEGKVREFRGGWMNE